MNMFNFSLNDVRPTNTTSYLKPYNIYENVTLDGIEVKSGTSAKGNEWKAMQLTFKCEEGIYTHSIFYITSDKDFERNEMDMPNGGKRQLLSSWERVRDVMGAVGFAFFPEDFEKLQAASSKAKSFEDIANLFIKCVNKNKGKVATKMKLVGRNSNGAVYATLPNCTGIAEAKDEGKASANNVKVGEWYTWMVSPFGDNLTFTPYEEGQKAKYYSAKPTSMPDTPALPETSKGSEDDDVDFDSLL